jgi:Spy/CpxP family protein refolding chaperone
LTRYHNNSNGSAILAGSEASAIEEINGLSLLKTLIAERMDSMKIDCIKKMIVIWATLTLGCAVAFAGPAQDSNSPAHRIKGPAPHQHAGEFMKELSEKLNLTNAQKAAIEPVLATEANEIKAVHHDGSLSDEQKQAKIKEIRDNGREKINALLTPEQQKKFAEMKGEAGNRMREGFQNRLAMLAEQLNLTDEQKTTIKPILAAEANDIKAVHQDNSLSKEQKQTRISEIRDASDKKINSLLTPEQQAKWAQLKEHAKGEHHKKDASGT